MTAGDALDGFATGKRQNREQTVFTPWEILHIAQETMGAIMLDPCAAREHNTTAHDNYYHPEQDGLELPWVNGTYVNPPFGDLKRWLEKSVHEYQRGVREQLLLVPVRARSRWWCDYMIDMPTAIAWLKRIKFVGYKQSYPEPLFLVYLGNAVPSFKAVVTFTNCANLITSNLREH